MKRPSIVQRNLDLAKDAAIAAALARGASPDTLAVSYDVTVKRVQNIERVLQIKRERGL